MKLWDYLNKEHGLILLDSEINDILELARQEIELPDIDDIKEQFNDADWTNHDLTMARQEGAIWAIDKARNPYPKSIRFKEDPDEFFKK